MLLSAIIADRANIIMSEGLKFCHLFRLALTDCFKQNCLFTPLALPLCYDIVTMLDFIKLFLLFLLMPFLGVILAVGFFQVGFDGLLPYVLIGTVIGLGNGIYQSHFKKH